MPYINGFPVCVKDDEYAIDNCPMIHGDLRCSFVKWESGFSSKLFVDSEPIVLHTAQGYCYNATGKGILLHHPIGVSGIPIMMTYQTEYIDED